MLRAIPEPRIVAAAKLEGAVELDFMTHADELDVHEEVDDARVVRRPRTRPLVEV